MLNVLLVVTALSATAPTAESVTIVGDQAMVHVKLADYDLEKASGLKRLRRRMAWAAAKVCDATIPGAMHWSFTRARGTRSLRASAN